MDGENLVIYFNQYEIAPYAGGIREFKIPFEGVVLSQSAVTTNWEPATHETVNNFDGVTMTSKEGTVSSTGLTVVLVNNSGVPCIYGEHFGLEKKIKGSWYRVPVVIEGSYDSMISLYLAPEKIGNGQLIGIGSMAIWTQVNIAL